MMKVEERVIDGVSFTYTVSDTYLIRKIGTDEIYSEAWDVKPFDYEETNIPINNDGHSDM